MITKNASSFDTYQRIRWREGLNVTFLSTYSPRACGLATFCEDLLKATCDGADLLEPTVFAMENEKVKHEYSWPVVATIAEHQAEEYEKAAERINDSPTDLICLQHEFGIFGGLEGEGIYRLLDRLKKPVISTLHTVLPNPEARVREGIARLAKKSQRLVVMNPLAVRILKYDYEIDTKNTVMMHHGAPPPCAETREEAKAKIGLSGHRLLCTFGLVNPGKGLEYVLYALPEIRRRYPDVHYLIVGQTHPGAKQPGEEDYREKLKRITKELGIEEAVQFINKYLTKEEIKRYLAAADIYVTPYLNPDQICSGTLAYAMAAGKAMVSTPYLYAKFLLGEGRGLLMDFRSSAAILEVVDQIFGNPQLQHRLEARALAYGQNMLWSRIGAYYRGLFRNVVRQYEAVPLISAPVSPTPAWLDSPVGKVVQHVGEIS